MDPWGLKVIQNAHFLPLEMYQTIFDSEILRYLQKLKLAFRQTNDRWRTAEGQTDLEVA